MWAAWKRSSRFSFLLPDRGGLLMTRYTVLCSVERSGSFSSRAGRDRRGTHAGRTRAPGPRASAGRNRMRSRKRYSVRPPGRRGGAAGAARCAERHGTSSLPTTRDATATFTVLRRFPVGHCYRVTQTLFCFGTMAAASARAAPSCGPTLPAIPLVAYGVALRHSLAALHTSKGLTRLTMPRPHHRGQ